MMGSSGGGTSEFGNIYDLIATLENPGQYEKKLNELEKRKQAADLTLVQATEESRKAEALNKVAAEMFEAANKKLDEANQIKADCQLRETALQSRVTAHEADKSAHRLTVTGFEQASTQAEANLHDRLDQVARHEASVQAAEQAIQAAKVQAEEDIASRKKAIEAERQSIIQAANAELSKAKTIRAGAEALADKIEERRRVVGAFFEKMPTLTP